jgi:hypothetical protein
MGAATLSLCEASARPALQREVKRPPIEAAFPLAYQASSFHFISGQAGAEVGSPHLSTTRYSASCRTPLLFPLEETEDASFRLPRNIALYDPKPPSCSLGQEKLQTAKVKALVVTSCR